MNQDQALQTLQKFMDVFDVQGLIEIQFYPPGTFPMPDNIVAFSDLSKRVIGFRENYIPDTTVAHEFFHVLAYENGYVQDNSPVEHDEIWAEYGERLWEATGGGIVNFRCDICGSGKVMLLPNGDLQCRFCNSVYGLT